MKNPADPRLTLKVFLTAFIAIAVVFAFRSRIFPNSAELNDNFLQRSRSFPDLSSGKFLVEIDDHPSLGNILIDSEGRSLYTFAGDTSTMGTCQGECSKIWPPFRRTTDVRLTGPPRVEDRLEYSEVIKGTSQITFDGHPLYYYAGDKMPGDVNGHMMNNEWFVVKIDNPY